MSNLNVTTKNVLKLAVSAISNVDPREWPPTCASFLYQPQRPVLSMKEKNMEKK